MCFETYAEAAEHSREGNKVVRFRSPEWVALRKQSEPAFPLVIEAPRESVPPQGEGETFLEYVFRFLSAYGFDQDGELISDVKHGSINTGMIDSALSRLDQSEISEFERMYTKNKHALLDALGKRFPAVPNVKSGCN